MRVHTQTPLNNHQVQVDGAGHDAEEIGAEEDIQFLHQLHQFLHQLLHHCQQWQARFPITLTLEQENVSLKAKIPNTGTMEAKDRCVPHCVQLASLAMDIPPVYTTIACFGHRWGFQEAVKLGARLIAP